uniref:Protein OS-9 homolog n=2 Tax=Anthurium amnicola TaxID=1678845 RepID=A0A1D1XVU6_9ARAE
MSNKKGQKYLCSLPVVEETRSVKPIIQQNTSNVIVEGDRRIKLRTPDELMEVLKDRCLYRLEGWWSYELCYQRQLRQFHLEDDKVTQEFVLGEFDPEATIAFNRNHSDISMLKDPRYKDASQRYHAHLFKNGTHCDLTNQPREAEIRFVCSESSVMISSIKEVSTCKYAVIVQCPLICKHPMFQQERPTSHTIHCNESPQEKQEADVESLDGKQITIITDSVDRFAT